MARGLDPDTGGYISAKAAAYPAHMNRQAAHVRSPVTTLDFMRSVRKLPELLVLLLLRYLYLLLRK